MCEHQISENAAACPNCGEPNENKKVVLENAIIQTKTKRRKGPLIVLVLMAILCLSVYFIYKNLMPLEEKTVVNRLATQIGISKVIPWHERAASAVNQLVGASKATIAENIRRLTHPTGQNATIINYAVRPSINVVTVIFQFDYEGMIFGDHFQMLIEWNFTKDRSISVNILEDTSPIPVLGLFKKKLDEYFASQLYGAVLKSLD
ncbi:MAG: hypothetical protein ABIK95_00160 [Acidobacteriota bacterium]